MWHILDSINSSYYISDCSFPRTNESDVNIIHFGLFDPSSTARSYF